MPIPEGSLECSVLLDTHAWIWLMQGESGHFKQQTLEMIEAAARRKALCITAISVWETAMLEAKGRIVLELPCDLWVEKALAGLILLPLAPRIAVESTRLPGEFHGDPADRIIVASGRLHRSTLLTNDHKILDYASQGYVAAQAL